MKTAKSTFLSSQHSLSIFLLGIGKSRIERTTMVMDIAVQFDNNDTVQTERKERRKEREDRLFTYGRQSKRGEACKPSVRPTTRTQTQKRSRTIKEKNAVKPRGRTHASNGSAQSRATGRVRLIDPDVLCHGTSAEPARSSRPSWSREAPALSLFLVLGSPALSSSRPGV